MLRFRPHHFLCSLGYQGKGYSSRFTANMDRIVIERLRAPGTTDPQIRVISVSDDICSPCPYRRGQSCEKADTIAALDRRHAEHLGLRDGQVISWARALDRIRERITPQMLDTLCAGCRWLDSGMCKQAVADLQDT